MTDERDPKLESAYRALGAEEPPRALDEAILAAGRRTTLPWTRRWAVPLSLAAVLVLSVTVTLRIQHEQPGIESPVSAPAPAPAPASAPAKREVAKAQEPVKPAAEPAAPARSGKPVSRPDAEAFPRLSRDRAAAQERRAEAHSPAPAVPPAQAQSLAKQAAPTPEQELERIAGLREQERHDEADKALAEFRKRYPDFKIPDTLLERVERR